MKKTPHFFVLAAFVAVAASAQSLKDANSAAQKIIDPFKAQAAQHLKTMQLPAGSPTVSYALDTITKIRVGSGKTIRMSSYVSNCPGVELPFAVDARAMTAGRATPGGKPLVVAGVLVTWDKGLGACGGVAMPAQFEVKNPVANSLPLVEAAGGDYKLAEAAGARLLPTMSPVPEIALAVDVRANEQLVGSFVIDATKQSGGRPTVIVGAIVFSPAPRPGMAMPSFMRAVHLVTRSPIGGAHLDIKVARP